MPTPRLLDETVARNLGIPADALEPDAQIATSEDAFVVFYPAHQTAIRQIQHRLDLFPATSLESAMQQAA